MEEVTGRVRMGVVYVRMAPTMRAAVDALAATEQRDRSAQIRVLLAEALVAREIARRAESGASSGRCEAPRIGTE